MAKAPWVTSSQIRNSPFRWLRFARVAALEAELAQLRAQATVELPDSLELRDFDNELADLMRHACTGLGQISAESGYPWGLPASI